MSVKQSNISRLSCNNFIILINLIGCSLILQSCLNKENISVQLPKHISNSSPISSNSSKVNLYHKEMNFERIASEDGLLSNEIENLFCDPSTGLWIIGQANVELYDGYNVRKIEEFNNFVLPKGVLDIKKDKNGSYYFLTNKGLTQLSNNKSKFFGFQKEIDVFNRPKITYDSTLNILWINNTTEYFNIIDESLNKLVYKNYTSFNVSINSKGTYFVFGSISTPVCELAKYNYVEKKVQEVKRIDTIDLIQIRGFVVDLKEQFWIYTQNSIMWKYSPKFDSLQHFGSRTEELLDYSFTSTMLVGKYIEKLDQVIIGTYGGVVYLVNDNGLEYPFLQKCMPEEDNPTKLPPAVILSIEFDANDNLFVHSYNAGINVYRPAKNKFTVLKNRKKDSTTISSNIVDCLLWDENNLWVGTKRGLSQVDLKKNYQITNYTTPNSSLLKQWVKDIELIQTDQLLLCYWGGTPEFFNIKTKKYQRIIPKNYDKQEWLDFTYDFFIADMSKFNNNEIYFANWSGGGVLDKYDISKNIYSLAFYSQKDTTPLQDQLRLSSAILKTEKSIFSGSSVGTGLFEIKQSEHGQLFYSDEHRSPTKEELILSIKKEDKVVNDSSKISQVNYIYKDNQDRIWICTPNGLFFRTVDDGQIVRIKCLDSCGLNNVVSVIQSPKIKSQYLIGTSKGLVSYDIDKDKVLEIFTKEDGLSSNSLSVKALQFSDSHQLAIGTNKGVNLIHFDSIYDTDITAAPFISAIYVDGQLFEERSKLKLSYDSKNIKFEFASSDLSIPSRNEYSYILENHDESWSKPSTEHVANFNNLDPGKYIFKVHCTNHIGRWSNEFAACEFEIKSIWYQTLFFKIFAFVCFLFFAWLFVRYLQKRYRFIEMENDRKIKLLQIQTLQSQINPHFIFNVLGSLQNQILNKNTEEANRHLINFSKLIRSFLDSSVSSSNSDLSSLRHSTISLEKEIELLKLYIEFEQLQRPDKFNFEINISPKIEPSNLSIPPLIVQPFVENAIKHGLMYKDDGKGLLKIDLEIENDLLIITIFDNGVGRKKAAEIQNESKRIYKSHGSKLVQDRVKILNELGYSIHIQIIDLEPSGTKVVLYIAD